jgi:hypothetical protein
VDNEPILDCTASAQQPFTGPGLDRRRELAIRDLEDALERMLGDLEFEAVRSIRIAVDDVTRQDDPGIPSNVVYTKAEALRRVFQEHLWPLKRAMCALRETC